MNRILTSKEQLVIVFLLALLVAGGIVHWVREGQIKGLKKTPEITIH